MKTINERTSIVLELNFLDENGAAVTPDSGRYQISDEQSETVLTSWTNFTPTTSSATLIIGQENNQIVDTDNDAEVRIVSVVTQRSSQQCTAEFKYEVKNLRDIPPNVSVVSSGGAVGGGTAVIV